MELHTYFDDLDTIGSWDFADFDTMELDTSFDDLYRYLSMSMEVLAYK